MIMYSTTDVKKNGPQWVKDNVAMAYMCIAPAKADDLATIVSKAIAQVAIAGADVSFTEVGDDLQVDVNAKTGIDPSGTAEDTDDIAVVYCSATVQLVCVDANDRTLTNVDGDTVNFPAARWFERELGAVGA